jgi:rubredoxin
MDKRQVVSDILEAYRKGKPNPTIEGKCSAILMGLSESMFKTATDWMLDNPPDYRIDVKYVKGAVRACAPSGIGFPIFEIGCPLCGLHFRHSPYAGSDHDDLGVHYYCPQCGLSGVEIMEAEDCLNKIGFCPKGWEGRLKRQAERWKTRVNRLRPDGFAPYYDRRLDEQKQEPRSKKAVEGYIEFLLKLQKEIRRARANPELNLK